MTRSVYNSPSADVCCIKLKLQNGTFLEEFKPQIKEAWLSRGERAAGFGLEREGPRRKSGTLARQCKEQQSQSWSKLSGGDLFKSASSSGKPYRRKALAGFNCAMKPSAPGGGGRSH